MKYDGQINIATGMSAKSKIWKNKKMMFSEFSNKIAEEHKTNETLKEFMAATKEDQTKIKDVGGYVGGYLRAGKRNPENVVHRQLMTLDIDFAHLEFWDDFTLQFENAAILHSTHKHCDASPRFRLLIPLSREASPDEYIAVARQIAGILGIELFDNTTFETNRLMFWPSTPKDTDYYFRQQDGPWVDVDEILDSYIDWKDTSLWPTADRKLREIGDAAQKQEDPESKKGIIGAFCRTYGMAEVLEEFLGDVYVPTADGKRYTYTKGTTSAGLMLYEDKFAYSYHGTDPCGGKLCNVFDLVRIHLFGHLDTDADSATKGKSFSAMEDLARNDKKVKKTIAAENRENAKYDFVADYDEIENVEGDQEDIEWMSELETDSKGKYLSSAVNINLIFSNDLRLKDAFRYNQFDKRTYVFNNLPWRRIGKPEPVKNVDFSGVRNYIESIYGISGSQKIEDSLILEIEKNSFHPIKDYLSSTEWDGTERIDTLLIDYFGTEDNRYYREIIRKTLVAAVARVYKPGCKFDMVLVLVGEQGTKKSSFIKKLGREWFSDTFMTVTGKEALEQIQGAWIIEMAELAGLKKAEVEAQKHFISKQEDTFRPAYGKTSETYPRQCVFIGSSNRRDFLTDSSGNRRFNPADVRIEKIKKDVWTDLDGEIDQIWAEAVALFNKGETLFLSKEAEKLAKTEQHKHSETDERRGLIEQYLDTRLPKDWEKMDVFLRRDFLTDDKQEGQYIRDYVCMAEIWCECLGKEKENMSRYNTREINDIMKSLEDWEYHTTTKNFKLYGKQKYYARKLL